MSAVCLLSHQLSHIFAIGIMCDSMDNVKQREKENDDTKK